MLFSSNLFLFFFLPVTLTGYYLIAKPYRNMFLFVMSLIFYAWGEPSFVLFMLGSIAFNWAAGLTVDALDRRELYGWKRAAMVFCAVCNLGLMFTYKYLDFAVDILNSANIRFLPNAMEKPGLILPIGISFFTFQAMSYVIDVYRGDVPVQKRLYKIGLYIAFFPQLIAGPIVRYSTIQEQIDDRRETLQEFGEGVQRFILGFSKKVILANNMALIADKAFKTADPQRSVAYAWLGAIAYSFQILFDFSGYSDMAIGLGKMFGFRFLENFDYPYLSKSISEFWRRWHMSLGEWFRDYVYFPLGGSRVKGPGRLAFNLFVVWILTGIWHGASWNFIWWGLFYFGLITFEKTTNLVKRMRNPVTIQVYRVFTLLCVMFGWVIFRAPDLTAANGYIRSMLGKTGNALTSPDVVYTLREYGVLLIACVFASTKFTKWLRDQVTGFGYSSPIYIYIYNCFAFLSTFYSLVWAVSYVVLGAYNPFIYFNF